MIPPIIVENPKEYIMSIRMQMAVLVSRHNKIPDIVVKMVPQSTIILIFGVFLRIKMCFLKRIKMIKAIIPMMSKNVKTPKKAAMAPSSRPGFSGTSSTM